MNSARASSSVYDFAFGSRAMRSPSSIAAIVSALGCSGMEIEKGMRRSRSTALVKTLKSDEMVKPVASQKAEIPALSSADMEMVRLAIYSVPFMKSSVLYNNRGVLHKDMVAKKTGFTEFTGLRRAAAVVILSTLTLTTFQAEAKIYRRRYSMKQQELNLQAMTNGNVKTVGDYSFEPIRGQPMLHWAGKRPFTSTQFYPAQEKERHGDEVNGWMNRIYWGDNLQVMSHLLKEFRGKVDLIYIDPPFDSGADYKKKIDLRGEKIENDQSSFEEKQYTDLWTNDEYLQFMYERLVLCRELLSDRGSIYLHCDWHRQHLLRCLMDEVFGSDRFQNELIWQKLKAAKKQAVTFGNIHDTILFYTHLR